MTFVVLKPFVDILSFSHSFFQYCHHVVVFLEKPVYFRKKVHFIISQSFKSKFSAFWRNEEVTLHLESHAR